MKHLNSSAQRLPGLPSCVLLPHNLVVFKAQLGEPFLEMLMFFFFFMFSKSALKDPQTGTKLTVGFLYGAGAETLIFVTGTSRKYRKIFVSQQKNQSQLWIPRKPRTSGGYQNCGLGIHR